MDNKPVTTEAEVVNFNEQPGDSQSNYIEYCSVKATSFAEKKLLYNSLKSCTDLLDNIKGEVLNLKNIYFKTFYSRKDKKDKARVILITDDGKSYVTGSFYVLRDLQQLFTFFGEPSTWTEPLKVKVTTRPVEKGNALQLELVD